MRFRCPYCGESSFSAMEKAGMSTSPVSRPVNKIFSMLDSTCHNCGGRAIKSANKNSKSYIVYYVILALLFLSLLFSIGKLKYAIYFLLAVIVLLPFFFVSLYFLTHYDLTCSEKEERDNVIVQFSDVLPFRKNTNEYVCEVKFERSLQIDKTYVIFDDSYKSGNKTLKFTMVAGKTPKQNEKLRIITNDGQYSGTVLEVIPKVKDKKSNT